MENKAGEKELRKATVFSLLPIAFFSEGVLSKLAADIVRKTVGRGDLHGFLVVIAMFMLTVMTIPSIVLSALGIVHSNKAERLGHPGAVNVRMLAVIGLVTAIVLIGLTAAGPLLQILQY